jgi:hypothetical protein
MMRLVSSARGGKVPRRARTNRRSSVGIRQVESQVLRARAAVLTASPSTFPSRTRGTMVELRDLGIL